jgi:outer membrane protein assembly factor BamB
MQKDAARISRTEFCLDLLNHHTVGAPRPALASFHRFSQQAEAALGAPVHGEGGPHSPPAKCSCLPNVLPNHDRMKSVARTLRRVIWSGAFGSALLFASVPSDAADQPQWGQAWSRNMVSAETNLPASFDPETGRNLKWVADLGTQTHSTPVVAGGRVYIGTNNGQPRDPKHQGDRGVLMCFEEETGRFLWQLVVPKRDEDAYMDWPNTGISSPVTVEGDRVYLVNNRGAVVCLDAKGMADGNDGPFRDEAAHMTSPNISNTAPRQVAGAEIQPQPLRAPADGVLLTPGPLDADIIWTFDLVAEAGIWPHDGAHSSILIHGDYLYLNTATGVDNTHKHIRTPDAPSLVVLNKHTGQYVARDAENMAADTFHAAWSSPSLAMVNGQPHIFFCGGNGVIYAFEPFAANRSPAPTDPGKIAALKKFWSFDFDPAAPKTNVHRFTQNRREGPSTIYGLPVVHENRLYVAGGGDLWWGKNQAWLKSYELSSPRHAGADETNAPPALRWSYPLEKHVMATPAVADGLVFIADCGRTFHCVDATTGQRLWTADIQGEVWASPMVADGKVYLGTRSGNFYVFAASREKQPLATLDLVNPISATVTPANGVLYLATMNRLYAVQTGAQLTR